MQFLLAPASLPPAHACKEGCTFLQDSCRGPYPHIGVHLRCRHDSSHACECPCLGARSASRRLACPAAAAAAAAAAPCPALLRLRPPGRAPGPAGAAPGSPATLPPAPPGMRGSAPRGRARPCRLSGQTLMRITHRIPPSQCLSPNACAWRKHGDVCWVPHSNLSCCNSYAPRAAWPSPC